MHSIRTGESGFEKVYQQPIFDWLSAHPEQAAVFDSAMVSVHGRETAAMIDAYDFSTIGVLADVGGGNGSVLREVLARHPNMRGMLCDLPGVIERAQPLIAQSGLGDRLQTAVTDFFQEVPTGADAYLMRHIIHDWDDEESLRILKNVRRAVSRRRPAAGGRGRRPAGQRTQLHQAAGSEHARSARRAGTHRRRVPHALRVRRIPPGIHHAHAFRSQRHRRPPSVTPGPPAVHAC